MSFFFRPAFYPERPMYSSAQPSISDDEAYYRRVAEEHQRRAQAALVLAQEEERRRRQAQRLYHEDPHFRPEYTHTRPRDPHGPFDFPFDLYDSQHPPRYEHLPHVLQRPSSPVPRSREQVVRDDQERRIEEWLLHRRQRELEEAEFRRLKELERRRDDELMREMLTAFGVDSLQRTRATPAATSSPRLTRRPLEELDNFSVPRQAPTHSQACACGRHIPSPQPAQASEPASVQPTSPSPDFATQMWNALSGGRSDEERANILRELGLGVSFNVTVAPNTRQPAPEQRSTPVQQTTAAPKPTVPKPQTQWQRKPAPIPVPITVRSPAPASPQPKSAPSPSPSPAPVKLSPFAHIASIQIKFDSLRSSNPDLSNHQKKREYLAELNKLLASLDAVESSGSESIRGARRALAHAVEEELDRVEASQEEEKHEVAEEKKVEEARVDTQEEEKPTAVEAAPEPETSTEHVPEEVEIQSVSESDPAQVHPAQATIEEPVSVPVGSTTTQPQPTEPETSPEPVQTEAEAHSEVPVTVPEVAVPTSDGSAKPEVNADDEKAHEASQDTEEQPERGRQPAVTSQAPKSPRTRRPPSVEIEEVPDEESLSGSPQVGYKDL